MLEVCDALGLHSGVTFIGHSVSCSVGMLASIALPGLFDRLVLLGPSPCFLNHPPGYLGGFEREDLEGLLELMDQNYIGWAQYLAPVASGEAGGAAASVSTAELSDSFCSTDPVVARVFAQTTFFADHRADLPKVTRPCLVLQHRVDALAPPSVGEYLHQHLQGSTLQVLDITGHCGHMSHPVEVIAAIRNYLRHAQPVAA
nr:alpha/beta hydrolase [Rhodoferax sp.]